MSSCWKKPRSLTREDKIYRDDRLFVIATEDTFAPEQYFRMFKNLRVHVRVLPTEDGLGKYNKRRIDSGHFSLENAGIALNRAEKLDKPPGNRWPQKTGSHVYKIVTKLLHA